MISLGEDGGMLNIHTSKDWHEVYTPSRREAREWYDVLQEIKESVINRKADHSTLQKSYIPIQGKTVILLQI